MAIKRAQIIAPTGSGKTRVEFETIEEILYNKEDSNGICIMVAPRISLVHQILNEFFSFRKNKWKSLCVCSSKAEIDNWYEGETYNDKFIETTTNEKEIQQYIIENEKIVLFCTLNSLHRINTALENLETKSDIVIFDEAHNLVSEEWSHYLDEQFNTERMLFFTATRKISYNSEGIGYGMNNSNFFGDVLYSITPKELMNTGKILMPRMHFVEPDKDYIDDKNEIKNEIACVISSVKKHSEIYTNEARIIVFCKSASDAHDMAESNIFKEVLPDWNVNALTSLSDRMAKNNKTRKKIFQEFSESKKSILFHYDIVSEGVDLPGATAIIPLRIMNNIKIIQAIGRVLRLNHNDKENFINEKICLEDKNKWIKPYGYIILPIIGYEFAIASDIVKNIATALRDEHFDFDVETCSQNHTPEGRELEKSDVDDGNKKYKDVKIFNGTIEDIEEIDRNTFHEIENLEMIDIINLDDFIF